MASKFQLVFTTCPDKPSATLIAKQLVTANIAACINILPGMTSVYQWQDQIETAEEHLLLIKSDTHHYQAIEKCILENHPYELPEIIAVPIEHGLPDYLNWINSCLC